MRRGMSAESTLVVFVIIVVISVVGLSFVAYHGGGETKENFPPTSEEPEETNVTITDFLVNDNDCDKENCEIQLGDSISISASVQSNKPVDNLMLHIWGVKSPISGDDQIDYSKVIDMAEAGIRTENFETTDHCFECGGISSDNYYSLHAEVSIDNKVFDSYTAQIYLY